MLAKLEVIHVMSAAGGVGRETAQRPVSTRLQKGHFFFFFTRGSLGQLGAPSLRNDLRPQDGAGCAGRLALPFLQLPPLPPPRLPLPEPRVGSAGITGTGTASAAPAAEDKCHPQEKKKKITPANAEPAARS